MNAFQLTRTTLIAMLAVLAFPAWAQTDISGTWAGDLVPAPDTTIEIHFVLSRQPDGSYTAVITSPDQGAIQNIPATDVTFAGNQLELTAAALSGSYSGSFADGTFTGNWTQPGSSIPLNLVPYEKPVLSAADKEMIGASWVGSLEVPGGGVLTLVFRFEDGPDGDLIGFVDSPDQGANGIAASNIEFTDGNLEFRIPQIGGLFTGEIAGDSLTGTWSQQGQGMPLTMARGEYAPAAIELSAEARARLEGSWVGNLSNGAGGTLTVVVRFETGADGSFAAFLDSPNQGASGIPITAIAVDGDQLTLTIPAAQASYTATIGDSQIDGTWQQGPDSQPLTLARGEYTPVAPSLALSAEAMEQLAGTWRGQLGPLEVIVRFESGADGAPVAYLDVPAQGANGLPIAAASLDEGQLSLTIAAISATYSGALSGNAISGQWLQGQTTNALTLARDQ